MFDLVVDFGELLQVLLQEADLLFLGCTDFCVNLSVLHERMNAMKPTMFHSFIPDLSMFSYDC